MASTHSLDLVAQRLLVLPDRFAIVPDRPHPRDEVLAFIDAPGDATTVRLATAGDDPWRGISSSGSAHGLEAPGMTASLLLPLAAHGIGVFVTSTWSADLVFVAERDLNRALNALTSAGHVLEE